MKKTYIQTSGDKTRGIAALAGSKVAYSDAVRIDLSDHTLLFISGKIGVNAELKIASRDMRDQTRQVLENIKATLEQQGGKMTDIVVSRLIEIWMAFPPVLLSILVVAIMGSGVGSVIAAIAIIDWTRFARVVRAETMAQAQADYVTAARTLGFGRMTILFREILPNVAPLLLGLVTLEMGIAVIVEAILSFVGLSVSSDTPTWGGMIAQGRQIIYQAWWVFALPLVALFATVLAFNQLGDGLRRALDPVMQR